MMKRYARRGDWMHRTMLDGEGTVLVPLVASKADLTCLFVLNDTAAFLWDELASPVGEDELCQRLLAAFTSETEPPEQVREGVRSCLGELLAMGAVQVEA